MLLRTRGTPENPFPISGHASCTISYYQRCHIVPRGANSLNTGTSSTDTCSPGGQTGQRRTAHNQHHRPQSQPSSSAAARAHQPVFRERTVQPSRNRTTSRRGSTTLPSYPRRGPPPPCLVFTGEKALGPYEVTAAVVGLAGTLNAWPHLRAHHGKIRSTCNSYGLLQYTTVGNCSSV